MALAIRSPSLLFISLLVVILSRLNGSSNAFSFSLPVHPSPHSVVSGRVVSEITHTPDAQPGSRSSKESEPWVWLGPSTGFAAGILAAVLGAFITACLNRRAEQNRTRMDQTDFPLTSIAVDDALRSTSQDLDLAESLGPVRVVYVASAGTLRTRGGPTMNDRIQRARTTDDTTLLSSSGSSVCSYRATIGA